MAQYKTEQEALEAVLATVKEIEGLAKSMNPLQKDEAGSPEDKIEDQAEVQGDKDAANAAPSPDMDEHAAEGQPAPEGEMAPEGQDQAEEDFDPASLSDEELHAILEMLTAELQKRESAQAPEAAQAPQAPVAPPAAPPAGVPPVQPEDETKSLAMSFKLEMEKMAKSQEALKKEIETLKKSRSIPVSRPASTNASSVAKVEAPTERLNKSESLDLLLNEQRAGKKVSSKMVADVNCVHDEEALHASQDRITKACGVKFTR